MKRKDIAGFISSRVFRICFHADLRFLERVNRFVYLSSTICDDGDARSEVRTRIGRASSAFNCMKNRGIRFRPSYCDVG